MTSLLALIGIELSAVSRKEKVVSAVGGLVAISLLTWGTHLALGLSGGSGIIASMGASAVLLFAVPHGQLSQPWPVLAGHGFAAAIGVTCYQCIPVQWLAAGCAVGLTILLMHQLKCIHPPGGATALTAVLGSDAVHALGFHFVWFPVLTNAIIMISVAVLFNWGFPWRRYPAVLSRAISGSRRPLTSSAHASHEDIVKALKSLDSFVDITEEDLISLSRLIAREQEARVKKTARNMDRVSFNPPLETAAAAQQLPKPATEQPPSSCGRHGGGVRVPPARTAAPGR